MTSWIKGISIAVIIISLVGIVYFLFFNETNESEFNAIMDNVELSQDQNTLTIQMRVINEGTETNTPERIYFEVCVDLETQCREFDEVMPPLPANTTEFITFTVDMSQQDITNSVFVQGFVEFRDDDGSFVTVDTDSFQINV